MSFFAVSPEPLDGDAEMTIPTSEKTNERARHAAGKKILLYWQ
jgi:hypothetical protein